MILKLCVNVRPSSKAVVVLEHCGLLHGNRVYVVGTSWEQGIYGRYFKGIGYIWQVLHGNRLYMVGTSWEQDIYGRYFMGIGYIWQVLHGNKVYMVGTSWEQDIYGRYFMGIGYIWQDTLPVVLYQHGCEPTSPRWQHDVVRPASQDWYLANQG